jgi:hypothetical protein
MQLQAQQILTKIANTALENSADQKSKNHERRQQLRVQNSRLANASLGATGSASAPLRTCEHDKLDVGMH